MTIESTSGKSNITLKTINVLLVGETQQGKSSFIKRLYEYAGIDKNVGIGNNTTSMTQKSEVHNIKTFRTEYSLKNTNFSVELNEDDFENLCNNKKVELNKNVRNDIKYDINMIDTPGLNDSFGNDEDNIINILYKINEIKKLNAVIFVTKVDTPYSNNFKKIFEYYIKSFPDLRQRFIILHTNFNHEKMVEDLYENSNFQENRKKKFKEELGIEVLHYFIDNKPNQRYRFREFISFQGLNDILSNLSSLEFANVNYINYIKTELIKNIDKQIKSRLEGSNNGYNDRIVYVSGDLGDVSTDLVRINKLKTDMETELINVQQKLNEYNNSNDEIIYTDSCSSDWKFFSTQQKEFNPQNLSEGYTEHKEKGENCEWKNELKSVNSYYVKLQGKWFRGIYGSVTIKNKKYIIHRNEINDLNVRKDKAQNDIKRYTEEIYQKSGRNQRLQEELENIQSYININNKIIIKLNDEYISINDYLVLKDNYKNENQEEIITYYTNCVSKN